MNHRWSVTPITQGYCFTPSLLCHVPALPKKPGRKRRAWRALWRPPGLVSRRGRPQVLNGRTAEPGASAPLARERAAGFQTLSLPTCVALCRALSVPAVHGRPRDSSCAHCPPAVVPPRVPGTQTPQPLPASVHL